MQQSDTGSDQQSTDILADTTAPRSSRSGRTNNKSKWSYIKWIVWTAVSGILNCRAPVFLPQFDDTWPIPKSVNDPPSTSSAGSETSLDNLDYVTEVNSINCQPEGSSVDLSASTSLNGTVTAHFQNHSTALVTAETHSPPPIEDSWMDLDEPCNPHTLLASYYVNAANSLIDIETRDKLAETLLNSVIPRNLSTLSEISVKPDIRKMYAWSKLPKDEEADRTAEFSKLEVNSTTSDDQTSADPGKISSELPSDLSSSPQSTMELSSPCEESVGDYERFRLNKFDREDQALAWSMSNLSTDSVEFSGSRTPPLSGTGESGRRSRDKSPVTTINSAKLSDVMSLPAFLPYDGVQSFDSTGAASTIEIPKPKRSSSLKSQRSPPGTPGQKAVRFADALGLDLTTVHHVPNQEVPPKVPASATSNLQLDSDESIAKIGAKQFGLCFAQPGAASNFIRRVLSQTVCLEDAYVDMPRGVLIGTIRVRSLGFEKRVIVRTSYNNWATFGDTPASYVQGSYDGATDRFSFSLIFPDTMIPGDRAQFAIRYETHTGEQFWDNNYGQNYSVTCYAKATDLAGDGSWVHYL